MTEPTPEPAAPEPEAAPESDAAPESAEEGPDLDLNVNAGDPLPEDDVDDGLES